MKETVRIYDKYLLGHDEVVSLEDFIAELNETIQEVIELQPVNTSGFTCKIEVRELSYESYFPFLVIERLETEEEKDAKLLSEHLESIEDEKYRLNEKLKLLSQIAHEAKELNYPSALVETEKLVKAVEESRSKLETNNV